MMRTSYVNALQGVDTSNIANQSVPSHSTAVHANTSQLHEKSGENSHILSQYDVNFIENNSHPLFLHNNDHPGLVLIAKKLIGPDNYAPWSRSMQIALNARNKFGIVNGSFEKPASNSPLYSQWERVNDLYSQWNC